MKLDLALITNWDKFEDVRMRHIDDAMKDAWFTHLGAGRHRTTYLAPHKRFVLKFPVSWVGLEASRREAAWWKKNHWKPTLRGVQFAPCRMISGAILMMRPVVVMYGHTFGCQKGRRILNQSEEERVSHILLPIPKWAGEVESNQIGILANGRWVAYDYADVYDY